MALLKMSGLQPVMPIQQLLDRIKHLETGVASTPGLWPAPAAASVPARTAPAPMPQYTPAAHSAVPRQEQGRGGGWERFVAFCLEQKPALGALLEHGSPLVYAPDKIEVGFPEGSYYLTSLQDTDNKKAVDALAAQFMHQPTVVRITSIVSDDDTSSPCSLAEKKKHDEDQRRESIRREVNEHPVVQEALRVLGGEIVEIKEL
jgi:DNA polymerase-3 subunit gamma/tau